MAKVKAAADAVMSYADEGLSALRGLLGGTTEERLARAEGMGYTTKAYSGSTHDFPAFDGRLASPEGDWGRASYASTSLDDVNFNYAGVGPDLTGRIDRESERVADELFDMDEWEMTGLLEEHGLPRSAYTKDPPEVARTIAMARLKGGNEGVVYPLRLNTEKYATIGATPDGKNGTFLVDDGEGDELYVRINDALGDTDAYVNEEAIVSILEDLQDDILDGSVSMTDLDAAIRRHATDAYDDSGDLVSPGGISAQVLKNLGYDGVIDNTVNAKFGTGRRYGGSMVGVDNNTQHIITFPGKESNIRSVNADFNPANANSPNLLAGLTGAAVIGSTLAPEEAEAGVITKGGKRIIEAWHGSPHSFDKFDISKIGTGEGAQAYGHGLYFADAPETAKQYRKELTGREVQRKFQEELPDDAEIDDVLSMLGTGQFTEQQERVIRALDADDWLGFDYPSQAINAAYRGKLSNYDPSPELVDALKGEGALYRTHIDVDPDTLLDYDKAINEQTPQVRAMLDRAGINSESSAKAGTMIGGQEQYLAQHGIPGIRYLDGNSRPSVWNYDVDEFAPSGQLLKQHRVKTQAEADALAAQARAGGRTANVKQIQQPDDGTYNYVMFDDKPISIVERGSANPGLLGTTAAVTGGALIAAPIAAAVTKFAESQNSKQAKWAEMKSKALEFANGAVDVIVPALHGAATVFNETYGGLQEQGFIPQGTPFADFFSQRSQDSQEPVRAVSALAALVATQDPNKHREVFNMSQEQIADEAGGRVTDYLSRAGAPTPVSALAGTAANVGVNLAGF